jgi:hypothetical protein
LRATGTGSSDDRRRVVWSKTTTEPGSAQARSSCLDAEVGREPLPFSWRTVRKRKTGPAKSSLVREQICFSPESAPIAITPNSLSLSLSLHSHAPRHLPLLSNQPPPSSQSSSFLARHNRPSLFCYFRATFTSSSLSRPDVAKP